MKNKQAKSLIKILGTGTSTGIPVITCQCATCLSLDFRDKRMRTSIYFETKSGQKVLVDTGCDLRTQLLNNKISALDFCIITHDHADHLHGLDDLRPFTFTRDSEKLKIYTNIETKTSIVKKFSYIFDDRSSYYPGGTLPKLELIPVPTMAEEKIGEDLFYFFDYPHGFTKTLGFAHEGFAYIVDCKELSDEKLEVLNQMKLDLLIIDCLQIKAHGTHLNVETCFQYIERINPKRAGLIHMGHELGHRALEEMAHERFGEKVFVTFDGMNLFY